MEKHRCTIGLLLYHSEYSELVTLDELKAHIKDNIEFNKSLDEDPIFRNVKDLRAKVWKIKDYADWRRNTDLTRFHYCPECGAVIEWAVIRRGGDKDG